MSTQARRLLILLSWCLWLMAVQQAWAQPGSPAGKKLIRVASEANSQMFITTLGTTSWAAAAPSVPTKVAAWQDTGFDGLSIAIASNDPGKGFTNMGEQWWNVQAERGCMASGRSSWP